MRKGVPCHGGQMEIGIRSEEERRTAYAEKTFARRGWGPLALHRAVSEMTEGVLKGKRWNWEMSLMMSLSNHRIVGNKRVIQKGMVSNTK